MKMYAASCDCGFASRRYRVRRAAEYALTRHRCPQEPPEYRCAMCGRMFWLLVDDGNLCLRCDALLNPSRAA